MYKEAEEDSKKERKKDNVFYYKLYFEIKIDTLMIGARKCQVNQVEREFCPTALTREDIAVFEGHWPTFATNVVNNNKYFTYTMLETSYKKLNGSGLMAPLGIIKTVIQTDYPT